MLRFVTKSSREVEKRYRRKKIKRKKKHEKESLRAKFSTFILEREGQLKIIEIIARKFSWAPERYALEQLYRTQISTYTPSLPPAALVTTWNPFSYTRKSLQPCRPRLGFRVCNFSPPPFVHLLLISPLSSARSPFASAVLFRCENAPLLTQPPLSPPWQPGIRPCFLRHTSLLARQLENPNEILKVWDLIFSPFTILCLQLQLRTKSLLRDEQRRGLPPPGTYLQMNREIRIKSSKRKGSKVVSDSSLLRRN